MLSLFGCGTGRSVGVDEFCGRKIVLKPRPRNVPLKASRGPSAGALSATLGAATSGLKGTSLIVKLRGIDTAVVR